MKNIDDHHILPSNPEAALRKTLLCIETLESIYNAEIEAMKKAKTKDFFALQSQKIAQTELYQNYVTQIIKRKDEIKKAPLELRTLVKQKETAFKQTSRSNLNEIQRMQRVVGRLGETIRKSAKEAAKTIRNVSYCETGEMANQIERSVSLTLNETA